jgi:hypothetical protein
VRTTSISAIAMSVLGVSCASSPNTGRLADGSALDPKILSSDNSQPPKSATIQLSQAGYVALLLVAPGHSATLLYPRDSATNNQMREGAHQITFQIPSGLVLDSTDIRIRRRDSTTAARPRSRTIMTPPIDPAMGSFLLLLTSPQRLDYARMVERTSGVTLPTVETEALNAIAKAIKSTLSMEPRDLAGFFYRIQLGQMR